MKRSQLSRRTPLRSRTPVKRVNPKRRASEFQRTYHSKERVAFVKARRCTVCLQRPSENAHIETGGMGRKADYTKIIPLCRDCHDWAHNFGIDAMQAAYGLDFDKYAAETERLWSEWQTREGE